MNRTGLRWFSICLGTAIVFGFFPLKSGAQSQTTTPPAARGPQGITTGRAKTSYRRRTGPETLNPGDHPATLALSRRI